MADGLLPDYVLQRTQQVAWLTSNCGTSNARVEYVRALAKHVDVEVWGACGNRTCGEDRALCLEQLSRRFRFYLAFENSNCRDYITEKFWDNALRFASSLNIREVMLSLRKSFFKLNYIKSFLKSIYFIAYLFKHTPLMFAVRRTVYKHISVVYTLRVQLYFTRQYSVDLYIQIRLKRTRRIDDEAAKVSGECMTHLLIACGDVLRG